MKAAAAGILFLATTIQAALAASVTQPGETVGISTGTPLPEGVYFIDTTNWGVRSTDFERTRLGLTIPVLVWATPAMLFGGRLQLLAATPIIWETVNHRTASGWFNPLLAGQLAWDLGGGFGISYLLGAYIRSDTNIAFDTTSLNQRLGLSYAGNDWTLSANIIYGYQFDRVTETINPDFLNVDLAAIKTFGKWQLGPVAQGSTDLNRPLPTYHKQSQIAVGGLIGYDFGPFTLQAYVTREVYEQSYSGRDTRVWGRIILPLWTAPTAPAPPPAVVTKG
jgi:hypothetical protein